MTWQTFSVMLGKVCRSPVITVEASSALKGAGSHLKGSSRPWAPSAEALSLAVRCTYIDVASAQLACLMACRLSLNRLFIGNQLQLKVASDDLAGSLFEVVPLLPEPPPQPEHP